MLPAFATVEALGVRLPEGIPAGDEPRAQAALDDVSTLIRSIAGVDWVDTDNPAELADDLPDIIVTVTLSAARRVLDNPDGIQQESIDNYSRTLVNPSGDVYLTANEKRLVRKAAGRSEIGSVELESPYQPPAATFVPVDIGGDDLPWVTLPTETV